MELIGRIHPGAIVLLHNTSSTNGKILDELLTRWEDMGYTFQPLSHLWSDEENKLTKNSENAWICLLLAERVL